MQKAESLYYECHLDEAFPLFEKLAEDGSGRAMYFLGEYYNHGLGKIRNRDEKKSHFWHKKGHMAGEVLCSLNLAYELQEDSPTRQKLCHLYLYDVNRLAEADDVAACNELGEM